ncbi:sulfurtransferase TusA family protein [Thermodesulfovibrio sp.]|uniref:sulfurtransferase TusA family protein n=1 Tax=Thermodesulfovibrio sp. TaxID=2067987 RepID=UPI0030AC0CB9
MADRVLDYCGLKCPYPILKLSSQYPNFKEGEIIEVIGDCPTFSYFWLPLKRILKPGVKNSERP